jgi:hypothetical protein
MICEAGAISPAGGSEKSEGAGPRVLAAVAAAAAEVVSTATAYLLHSKRATSVANFRCSRMLTVDFWES